MAQFVYNNVKNATIDCTFFELNYAYHLWVSYKKDIDSYSKSKIPEELSFKLCELMTLYQENLKHGHEFQKSSHNMYAKPRR